MDWREKPGACGRLARHNRLMTALTLSFILFFILLLLFLLLGFFGFFEKPLGF